MAQNELFIINFIFQGGGREFYRVEVPSRRDIYFLQSSVHQAVGSPSHLLDSDLKIWKLAQPLVIKPVATVRERLEGRGALMNIAHEVTELTDTLEIVFQEKPKATEVLIIVTTPSVEASLDSSHAIASSTGVRKHNHSPSPPDDSAKRQKTDLGSLNGWLFDLHSALWGREDLRSSLFFETTITIYHYRVLKRRLMDLYPHRDSEEYDSTDVDISSIKRDILHSSTPAMPGGVAGTEESQEEDSGVHFFLPTKIRYLDLSFLKLQRIPLSLPLPLLIREEYNEITRLINTRSKGRGGSTIISGQPKTGKLTYIYFQMIEHIISGSPFIYQSPDGNAYTVSTTCTKVGTSWPEIRSPITAFIDIDKNKFSIHPFLKNKDIRLILAASPNAIYNARNPDISPENAALIITKLWTPQEIFVTGIFLHYEDHTFRRLREAIEYFGCNPPRCFRASLSKSLMEQATSWATVKIFKASQNTSIQPLFGDIHTVQDISDFLFEISPTDDTRFIHLAQIETVSTWALEIFLDAYEVNQSRRVKEFYDFLVSYPYAASLRGRIFEGRVLKYLDSLEPLHDFPIRSLKNSTVIIWSYPGPTQRTTFASETFASLVETAVSGNKPLHLVPSNPNFAALDSIVYEPGKRLVGIQATISDHHPIAVSGLKRIQNWLRQNTPLANLRASTKTHWALIFVTPEEVATGFRQQAFDGDTEKNKWAGLIDQYVLGLGEDVLWRRTEA